MPFILKLLSEVQISHVRLTKQRFFDMAPTRFAPSLPGHGRLSIPSVSHVMLCLDLETQHQQLYYYE